MGLFHSARTQGLMASGNFQTLDWYLSANNGSDGVDKKYLFNGRIEWDAVGGGVAVGTPGKRVMGLAVRGTDGEPP